MNPQPITPKATVLAIDPGFGYVKLKLDGRPTISLRSAIARMKDIGLAGVGMKTASQAMTIGLGWDHFVIGDGAWNWGDVHSNRDYSAIASLERRALTFGALSLALDPGTYAFDQMVIGLPVPLLLEKEQSLSVLTALKAYKGTHDFKVEGRGEYKVSIHKLKALAQPVGAYADWLLDDELRVRRNGREAEVAVLDIGMNTLDLYVLKDGRLLPRFVGGEKVGVRRLLEILDRPGMEPEELDAQIRTGKLRPTREQLDSWLSEILAALERTWPNLRRFTTILPAGGGSILLGDLLRVALIAKGAAVTMPDDPAGTNARGLWKWAAYGR